MQQPTILEVFKELDNLVGVAEQNLAQARKRVDDMAAQFGFVKKASPPLPGLYPGDKNYPGHTDPADFQA